MPRLSRGGSPYCPKGSFLDPRLDDLSKGGECWQCPDDYNRTAYAVTDSKACSKLVSNSPDKKGDASVGCQSGEFPNAGLSKCYSCPSGYNHNPLYTVDNEGVCKKPGETTKKKGTKKKKSVVLVCPKGQWVSTHDGYCYDCPSGYSHDPSKFGNQNGVCYKKSSDKFSKATYKRDMVLGCPDGQWLNIKDGKCYTCPGGFSHNPAFTADMSGVCFKEDLKGAKFVEKIGCGTGKFFDPRNGGECWSCPDNYDRTVLWAVTDDKACLDPLVLPCDKIDFFSQAERDGCPAPHYTGGLRVSCRGL